MTAGDFRSSTAPLSHELSVRSRLFWVLVLNEIVIGRCDRRHRGGDALGAQVRRSVIAQQLRLGFVTAIDPTPGQQGM